MHALSRRIDHVLQLEPGARAVEYAGHWLSWARIGDAARRIAPLTAQHPEIGVLLRNRPGHVAALLGVLLGGGTIVTLNPARGDDRTRADLAALGLPLVIGESADLAKFVASGSATLAISGTLDDGAQPGPPSPEAPASDIAVRMLTSGTTGPPKRIDLSYRMLAHSVLGAGYQHAPEPSALRRGVAIVNSPLVHIGGVFRVLQCVAEGRPFVLLERFELNAWADAVREHRPRAVSLVPAALRTVLHSDLTRADLAGIRAVTCGTAPLSAEDADAFTEKYGIPVLTSYAATEFGGGVAGWTLADHQQYWRAKRGSVGRANPGARLRVVDDDGTPLQPDRVGRLQVKPAQLGPTADWMQTNDLARLDGDGFLWILGRADQAIIRGGFKIMPDEVRTALEAHPAVAGAVVVGVFDERLGETPVAMVELRAPATADELLDHLRTRLARYEIPTEIATVEAIPRTSSGKADLGAIKAFFSATPDHAR